MRRQITMRVAVAASVLCASPALAAPAASAAVGDLTQKPGAAGCFSPSIAGCSTAATLAGASGVALSPGGTQVYVTASGDPGAVTIFDRDAAGALTPKPGTAGCVSEGGAGGSHLDLGLSGRDLEVELEAAGVGELGQQVVEDRNAGGDGAPGAVADRDRRHALAGVHRSARSITAPIWRSRSSMRS